MIRSSATATCSTRSSAAEGHKGEASGIRHLRKSYRDVEEVLAERAIAVSYETVRAWVAKFGAQYAGELRRREVRRGRTSHLDEMATRIGGRIH